MFCPNCGATLSDDAQFCGVCGAKIENENGAQQPFVQPAQNNNAYVNNNMPDGGRGK